MKLILGEGGGGGGRTEKEKKLKFYQIKKNIALVNINLWKLKNLKQKKKKKISQFFSFQKFLNNGLTNFMLSL